MRSSRTLFLFALTACLIARLFLALVPASVPFRTKAVDAVPDGPEYVRLADNLARHRVFSRDTSPPYRAELFRTPGYPVFLALLQWADDNN